VADFGISILLSAPTYTLTQIQLAQVYVDTQGHADQRRRANWVFSAYSHSGPTQNPCRPSRPRQASRFNL
jgi:hypothetical protein